MTEEELRGLKGVAHYPFTILLGNNSYTSTPMKEIPLNDEIHGAFSETYKWHFNLDWTDAGIEKYYNKGKVSESISFPFLCTNSSLFSSKRMRV